MHSETRPVRINVFGSRLPPPTRGRVLVRGIGTVVGLAILVAMDIPRLLLLISDEPRYAGIRLTALVLIVLGALYFVSVQVQYLRIFLRDRGRVVTSSASDVASDRESHPNGN